MTRSKLSRRSKGTVDALVRDGINGKKPLLCTVDDQGILEVVTAGLDNVSQATQSMIRQKHIPAANKQQVLPGDLYMAPQTTTVPEAAVQGESSKHITYPLSDEQNVPTQDVTHSFRLHETQKVAAFLARCLILLQQQVGKRIAKQWIKGICPKKQARYPYQNKQRERQENKSPEVPEWWPPTDGCDFREPDHITKEHRLSLCLHLLRLRATPGQLQMWNGNGDMSESVKVLETRNWTAFLKSLTPPSIFDGLDPEKPWKRKGWEKLLNDMYKVADMEESYIRHERDGNDVYSWTDDTFPESGPPRRQPIRKRSRQSSPVSSSSRRSSERSSSTERIVKKTRRTTETSQPSPNAQFVSRMSNTGLDEGTYAATVDATVCRNTFANVGLGLPLVDTANMAGAHFGRPVMRRQYSDHPRTASEATTPTFSEWAPNVYYNARSQMSSPTTTALKSSFGSVHQEHNNAFSASRHQELPATTFPGKQDYAFNQPTQGSHAVKAYSAHFNPQPQFDTVPNMPGYPDQGAYAVKAYSAHHIPQPRFDTVPNTPVCSSRVPNFLPHGYAGHEDPTYPNYGPQEVNYAAVPQQYQVQQHQAQENDDISTRIAYGPPHVLAGFAVQPQYPAAHPIMPPHQQQEECLDCKPVSYQRHPYSQVTQSNYQHAQQPPYDGQGQAYPETRPEQFFQSEALPGSVHRGFTGNSSGVGGGAMT